MPRPPKCRRICFSPQYDSFCPENGHKDDTITLTLDEYEVIRLVDLEKRTHEQCSDGHFPYNRHGNLRKCPL